MELEAAKVLAAGVCMGLGAIGPGIGEGVAASKGLEAMGRNPPLQTKFLRTCLFPWLFVNRRLFTRLFSPSLFSSSSKREMPTYERS